MDNLLRNAFTKHEAQIINQPVIFQGPVAIHTLNLKNKSSPIFQKIHDIVSDAVIDDAGANPVLVKAAKIFKNGLVTNNLEVTGNIDMKNVNGLDIDEFNSQIFKKYNNDTVDAPIVFLGEIKIGNLITKEKIHGVGLHDLAVKNEKMPKLHFKHLIVANNVTLYKLDGVDFEDFVTRRVDIRKDQEIHGDVEFTSPVAVIGTYLSLIYSGSCNTFKVNYSLL